MRPLERARILNRCNDMPTLPERVKSVLRKYGATILLPNPFGRHAYGFQSDNYRESNGLTGAAVDDQIGLVADSAPTPIRIANSLSGFSSVGGSPNVSLSSLSFTTSTSFLGVTIPCVVGRWYRVTTVGSTTSNSFTVNTYDASPARTEIRSGFGSCVFRADRPFIYLRHDNAGTTTLSSMTIDEIPGIQATQTTSGYRPYLRSALGVQSWEFDGVDDRLTLSSIPFQMSDNHCVVIGATATGGGHKELFAIRSTSSPVPIVAGIRMTTTNALAMLYRSDADVSIEPSIPGAVVIGVPLIATLRKNGDVKQLRKDAGAWITDSTALGTTTVNLATLGATVSTGFGQFLLGNVHSAIFIKGAPSDSELLILERFVARLQGRNI